MERGENKKGGKKSEHGTEKDYEEKDKEMSGKENTESETEHSSEKDKSETGDTPEWEENTDDDTAYGM